MIRYSFFELNSLLKLLISLLSILYSIFKLLLIETSFLGFILVFTIRGCSYKYLYDSIHIDLFGIYSIIKSCILPFCIICSVSGMLSFV